MRVKSKKERKMSVGADTYGKVLASIVFHQNQIEFSASTHTHCRLRLR
jgi:hypothetical protein